MEMDYKIIDAHAHLWLKQDAVWNGKRIRTLENGRSHFLGEEVQMVPPFMIDGRNTAEVFLSNMNYAQVSAAVITQEYIDGHQNDYLQEVQTAYPDRFFCCGMCEYFDEDVVGQAKALKERGFKAIKIPGNRLKTDAVVVELQDKKMADLFAWMEKEGMMLSIDLDDDSRQIAQLDELLQQHPDLKTAIGHFGMATFPTFMEQVRLAHHPNVMIESGGITWLYNAEFYPFRGAVRAIRQAADEAGMEGGKDPFNRRTYPWGRENRELLAHFKRLGRLRAEQEVLRLGDIQFFQADQRRIGFTRTYGESKIRVYLNRGSEPWEIATGKILFGHNIRTLAPETTVLGQKGFCVIEEA